MTANQFKLPLSSKVFGGLKRIVASALLATHLRGKNGAIETYVLLSTVILIGLFSGTFFHAPGRGWVAFFVTLFIVYRLAEMLMAGIELINDELTIEAPAAAAVAVIYLVQTLLCFTLLAQTYGRFLDDQNRWPPSPTRYLFMIWGYVSTIGSTYTPASTVSVIIAISAGVYALLLLGVFLAFAVGNVRKPMNCKFEAK